MRRAILFLVALLGILYVYPSYALADEPHLDQYNHDGGGNVSIIREGGIRQYFVPTVSHLTKVGIQIQTGAERFSRFSLFVFNENGDIIYQHTFEEKTNNIDSIIWTPGFDAAVAPGSRCHIKLLYLGSGDVVYWSRSNSAMSDGNPDANAHHPGPMDYDMWFEVYGYSDTTAAPTGEEDAAGTNGDSETPSETSASGGTSTTANSQITPPVLSYIERNGLKIKPPYPASIQLKTGDKLRLTGSSFSGAKVTLILNKKTYSADISPDGGWNFYVPVSSLKPGAYSIEGRSDSGGKTSKQVYLLKIRKAETKPKATDESSALMIYAAAIALLIIMITAIGIIAYKMGKRRPPGLHLGLI